MDDNHTKKGLCDVCGHDSTSIHAEISPGRQIFVCEKCLETAKDNFIWICVQCRSVFIRPKSLVLARLRDPDLKHAYAQCANMQIIQGIDRCIECDADGVRAFVAAERISKHSGHC